MVTFRNYTKSPKSTLCCACYQSRRHLIWSLILPRSMRTGKLRSEPFYLSDNTYHTCPGGSSSWCPPTKRDKVTTPKWTIFLRPAQNLMHSKFFCIVSWSKLGSWSYVQYWVNKCRFNEIFKKLIYYKSNHSWRHRSYYHESLIPLVNVPTGELKGSWGVRGDAICSWSTVLF